MSQEEIKKLTASLSSLSMEEKWKGTCTTYGSSYKFTFYTDKKKVHLFGEFLKRTESITSFAFSIKDKCVVVNLEKEHAMLSRQEAITKILSYPTVLSPFGIGPVSSVSYFRV